MCILIHALKKKHVKREEVVTSMNKNKSGFFMAALRPGGSRETLRTLNYDEALKFFDEKVHDDDEFVMHARIPSKGEVSLGNVHGWEEDGIIFGHNMTIYAIDDMMKRAKWENTDSEFFFRRILMPYFRGFGADAYKNGVLHPDIENFIEHFIGTSNKFMLVMPDNKVFRFGNWVNESDRKENGQIAFWASNGSYKSYPEVASFRTGVVATNVAGFRQDWPTGGDDYDDYGEYGYEFWWERNQPSKSATKGKKRGIGKKQSVGATAGGSCMQKTEAVFDGEMLLELVGVEDICKIAVAHLAIDNAVSCRHVYSKAEKTQEVEKALRNSFPKCFNAESMEVLKEELSDLTRAWLMSDMTKKDMEDAVKEFASGMAMAYEEDIVKSIAPNAQFRSRTAIESGIKDVHDRIGMLRNLLNMSMDFSRTCPEEFIKAFIMTGEHDSLIMESIMIEDLLSVDVLDASNTIDTVKMILCFINKDMDKFYDWCQGDGEIDNHDAAKEDANKAESADMVNESSEDKEDDYLKEIRAYTEKYVNSTDVHPYETYGCSQENC